MMRIDNSTNKAAERLVWVLLCSIMLFWIFAVYFRQDFGRVVVSILLKVQNLKLRFSVVKINRFAVNSSDGEAAGPLTTG